MHLCVYVSMHLCIYASIVYDIDLCEDCGWRGYLLAVILLCNSDISLYSFMCMIWPHAHQVCWSHVGAGVMWWLPIWAMMWWVPTWLVYHGISYRWLETSTVTQVDSSSTTWYPIDDCSYPLVWLSTFYLHLPRLTHSASRHCGWARGEWEAQALYSSDVSLVHDSWLDWRVCGWWPMSYNSWLITYDLWPITHDSWLMTHDWTVVDDSIDVSLVLLLLPALGLVFILVLGCLGLFAVCCFSFLLLRASCCSSACVCMCVDVCVWSCVYVCGCVCLWLSNWRHVLCVASSSFCLCVNEWRLLLLLLRKK